MPLVNEKLPLAPNWSVAMGNHVARGNDRFVEVSTVQVALEVPP
jgi:hypothetical protein